jgi:hypothetical protein
MAKFQPGQSGNPGGRPKVVGEVQELARVHTSDAMRTLVSVMNDDKAPPAARTAAACAVLDRGYGRPAQFVGIESHKPLEERSDEELLAIASASDDRDEEPGAEPEPGRASRH